MKWSITLNLYQFGVITRGDQPLIILSSFKPSISALREDMCEMLGLEKERGIQSNWINLSRRESWELGSLLNSTLGMVAYMRPFQKAYLCRLRKVPCTNSHMASDTTLESSLFKLFVPSIGFEQPTARKKVIAILLKRVTWSFAPHLCLSGAWIKLASLHGVLGVITKYAISRCVHT